MNPDAFIAVLPAYLVVLGESENELPALVLGELTRKEGFRDAFDARIGRMTVQQRSVISRLLERLAYTEPFSRHYGSEIPAAVASWRAAAATNDSEPGT